MKAIWLTILCLLLLSAPSAQAQTHPCDQTVPSNPNVGSPVKFGFCMPTASVTPTYKVYLDTNPTPVFSGPLTPIGSPSPSGKVYLETPSVAITSGTHSYQAASVDAIGQEARSTAYPFVVIGPPVAPSNPRVIWP